jgi:hypothetical protein
MSQSGATDSLRRVGEWFAWEAGASAFAYTSHNHTSVIGIRAQAVMAGADVISLDPSVAGICCDSGIDASCATCAWPPGEWNRHMISVHRDARAECDEEAPHLFAFPAECNFSGVQHDLAFVERLQQGLHWEGGKVSLFLWFVVPYCIVPVACSLHCVPLFTLAYISPLLLCVCN